MRVVHYLNQFFGGLGGEERAGAGLEVREGAVGPAKLLEELLGADAKVVMTLVCGDNYAVENQKEMIAVAVEKIRAANPDLFVAGPCFQAGRYGIKAWHSRYHRDERRKSRGRSLPRSALHR